MPRRALLFCCLAVALNGFGRDPVSTNSLSLAQVRTSVEQHLSSERFRRATWGVKIVSLDTGRTLFETNAQKLLKPASNAKLFTAALALDLFGADFRVVTSVYSSNRPGADGVLAGDLIVYGRGDPLLAARSQEGRETNLLERFIAGIRAAGIRSIKGNIVGDDTFFSGPPFGSNWTWDDLQFYHGAEVSALTARDNVVDLIIRPGEPGKPCSIEARPQSGYLRLVNRTITTDAHAPPSITPRRPLGEPRVDLLGSLPVTQGEWRQPVPVPKPALWFATLLKEALEREGISIAGRPAARSWPEDPPLDPSGLRELAQIISPPLSVMLEKMMKPSQNLHAQLLLLQAGARSRQGAGDRAISTEALGIRELRAFLGRAGIDAAEVLLDEGSGLSRACLVTPNAIVGLLQFMSSHKHAREFRAALPEAGVDGTLRTRLLELSGNLRAKTGSIRHVNALSGYLKTAAGENLAFSILLNAHDGPSGSDEIDKIPPWLARIGEQTRPNGGTR